MELGDWLDIYITTNWCRRSNSKLVSELFVQLTDDPLSELLDTEAGISQGAILRSVLFLIYNIFYLFLNDLYGFAPNSLFNNNAFPVKLRVRGNLNLRYISTLVVSVSKRL